MEKDRELVTIAKFFHEHEAHILRNALNDEGVPAMVAGNNTSGFGMEGIGLAGIEVNVRKIDLDAARKILESIKFEKPDIAEWVCSCGARVDAGFAVCWSCGRDHEKYRIDEDSKPDQDDDHDPGADETN